MAYIILNLVLIFFAILGFTQFIKFVICRFYGTNSGRSILIISPTEAENSNPEFMLRHCIASVRWIGNFRTQEVVCLSDGMTENSKKICALLSSENEFVHIMTCQEFSQYLQSNNSDAKDTFT